MIQFNPSLHFFLLLLMGISAIQAQYNSPYSRYNLGDVYNNTNIALQGMGSASTALMSDKNTINSQNPASYTSLQLTLLNLGLNTQINNISDKNGNTNQFTNINISSLQLAFPAIPRIMGIVLGFEPRSIIKYNILDKSYFNNGGIQDSINLRYSGDGGTYFAYAGLAVGYKYFSLGANIGYYWGQKISSIQNQFFDNNIFSSNTSTTSSIGGFYAELGGIFHIPIYKNHALHIGATTKIPQKIPTTTDKIYNTYYATDDFGNIPIDTVLNESIKSNTQLPLSYSMGLSYDNTSGVILTTDITITHWSNLFIEDPGNFQGLALNNQWLFRMGGEFVPFFYGNSYFNFIAYRMGFNVGNTNLSYQGKPISQFEISAGVGLPIKRFAYNNTSSTINISLCVGQNGDKYTPLQSTYYRIGVSFSLGDIWFIKRKYD
ncbi:MAG: hypothetical protein ACRCR9_00040 [Chitinophagaceae bacterium]